MVKLTIDNLEVEVKKGTTILDAAASVGIKIPTLCYLRDINEIGACRVCLAEIKGKSSLVASCNTLVEEGMEVYTNSKKVMNARRTNVELMLSQHDCRCAICVRSGNCSLQTLANDLDILEVPFKEEYEVQPWNMDFPLIRDSKKCIKCMRCVQVCDKIQGLNVWDIINTGKRTSVGVKDRLTIEEAGCSLCGQCITHCPVGALRERDDLNDVVYAIHNAHVDERKVVIAQIAPAVRAAWGERFGLGREEATVGRLVAALRRIGIDYVFDTNFTADLTIMEEATEFLERFQNRQNYKFPMFTSCCPGWVRFLKHEYPDMIEHLSTAKSPQQMFGAVAKTYYADILGVEPEEIYCISIMPCTAKKYESRMEGMDVTGTGPDVDAVITTREVERLIRAEHIQLEQLEEEEFDEPLGCGSGAAVIFGATGGVMEAALRSAYYFLTGENPKPDAFSIVRGQDGIREAKVEIAGVEVKAAVVSGLGNTRKLIERIRKGEAEYDFVEVMACPGGCSGGGGQPIHDNLELAGERAEILYLLDEKNELRFSHENPAVLELYRKYLGRPLSHKSHELLHTDHFFGI